jgi:hypothetical protein
MWSCFRSAVAKWLGGLLALEKLVLQPGVVVNRQSIRPGLKSLEAVHSHAIPLLDAFSQLPPSQTCAARPLAFLRARFLGVRPVSTALFVTFHPFYIFHSRTSAPSKIPSGYLRFYASRPHSSLESSPESLLKGK